MTERDIKTGDIFISRFTFQGWTNSRHIRVKLSEGKTKNLKTCLGENLANKIAKRVRVK